MTALPPIGKYDRFYTHTGNIVPCHENVPANCTYTTNLKMVSGVWVTSDGQRYSNIDGMPLKVALPLFKLDQVSIKPR